ncbi:antibiotic biosynthesis monooxygenase [Chitiniphilus purpureus]|uniref:Antibiotic biosynthesis monooxygenase n=1 Tax=Chitiniphilus purpureus TaxID=2981137 RepID=A0ABY6DLG3_9NEIS|nr:antibiotic biosynthesis monooxygenase [Chitiniphilus sp. CD1]UXY15184.1 antibiotic biosynthesis monooxygenase [Chitiniphilus sp. CD1]
MITATFIFDKKQFDDDFHALDQQIAEAARSTTGYLGEEAWENTTTGRISTVYYWSSEEGLRELMNNPSHLIAKGRYKEWLSGYRVEISQVLRTYGDGLAPSPAEQAADNTKAV